jgi:class 3 adenylate cyclase
MQEGQDDKNDKSNGILAQNHRLKTFLSSYSDESTKECVELQPIADFFPHCTVMFADIAGFTAWSSTREPVQVFILLQTLYQAFDVIAKRHKVWKVETIGDSYVAVTGLPHPQERHAVIMARFSAACMLKMLELTSELEKTLGPDTGECSVAYVTIF